MAPFFVFDDIVFAETLGRSDIALNHYIALNKNSPKIKTEWPDNGEPHTATVGLLRCAFPPAVETHTLGTPH